MGEGTQRLAGRVALVTGASRGLGKAIALAFADEGAAVVVAARSQAQWDPRLPGTILETVAEIEARGGRAIGVPTDLAKEDDVERLVAESRAAFGPVDLLVNNAALTVPGRPPPAPDPATPSAPAPADVAVDTAPARPSAASGTEADRRRSGIGGGFLDFPLRGYRLHFDVGVFACFRLMQLVLPDMIRAGRGAIVNISSLAASIPGEGPYEHPGRPTGFAYGGNKAALEHLTRAVAFEMAVHGIAVNALSPSEPVITPGNLVAAPGTTEWASPEDFAEATVRLALATPDVMTGVVAWSDDVLHPELGRRGWLGDQVAG
jgi:NAD(P)-dependent dehydrogenase (short-subunit alcohol dehydrogenase family)